MDTNNDNDQSNQQDANQPLDQQPENTENSHNLKTEHPQASQEEQKQPEPQFTPPQPASVAASSAQQAPVDPENQKSRLAMMSFAYFAIQTGIARVYIGDKSGYVRLWLFIGAFVLAFIPFINILSGLIMLVLSIWGLIDYFILKKRTTDASGQPLHTNKRDDKSVNIITIVLVASLVLMVLFVVLAIALFVAAGANFYSAPAQPFPGSFELDTRDVYKPYQPSI